MMGRGATTSIRNWRADERVDTLGTPAVIVDLDCLEANIARDQAMVFRARHRLPAAHQDAQGPQSRSPATFL